MLSVLLLVRLSLHWTSSRFQAALLTSHLLLTADFHLCRAKSNIRRCTQTLALCFFLTISCLSWGLNVFPDHRHCINTNTTSWSTCRPVESITQQSCSNTSTRITWRNVPPLLPTGQFSMIPFFQLVVGGWDVWTIWKREREDEHKYQRVLI